MRSKEKLGHPTYCFSDTECSLFLKPVCRFPSDQASSSVLLLGRFILDTILSFLDNTVAGAVVCLLRGWLILSSLWSLAAVVAVVRLGSGGQLFFEGG